jgi:enterochelin esterase-like enzyme
LSHGVQIIPLRKEGDLVKQVRVCLCLLPFACLVSNPGSAQIPNRPAGIADTLQTVTVGPDNRVTFKFYAPQASSVTVSGDFLMGAPPANLVKGEDGVWSFTSNPIPPDSYTYNFTMDGVMVLDTRNSNFREDPNALFNFFDMSGPDSDFEALHNVPHGRVEQVIYHSNSLSTERRMRVYLPPNFDHLKGKLPVLYLLHGGGDNDISWTSAGKINLVLDNLYAGGKLKDMIVVMPSGHVPGPVRSVISSMSDGPDNDPFLKDFLNDIVPFIEKTYPVSTKREDRAIAGFSMGGVQTLNLSLWHPEMFNYVYAISTGYFPNGIQEIREKYSAVMKNVASHPFKQFVLSRGKDDTLVPQNCEATRKMLEEYGIHYEYKEMNGGHSFVFSRRFLASAFPQMFR